MIIVVVWDSPLCILYVRNQQESDLRENHPYFDTPLFMVGRESRFREICKTIVSARYSRAPLDSITGQESKVKYKKLAYVSKDCIIFFIIICKVQTSQKWQQYRLHFSYWNVFFSHPISQIKSYCYKHSQRFQPACCYCIVCIFVIVGSF